jgi:predicted small lipoprotein YifL
MGMARKVVVLMAAVGVLAGCGQKGPLYLPDKGGEVVTRPGGQAQQPAPQSQPGDTDGADKKKGQQNPPK